MLSTSEANQDWTKKNQIKKIKNNNKEKSIKEKNPKKKKEKGKEFVFNSPGQNVHLLSLPHFWFSVTRKEGQL